MIKYIKPYLPYAFLAAIFMIGEVMMDLLQPNLMSRIIDEGVLGISNNGVGSMTIIIHSGLLMIALVIFGGLSGSLNNVFVHMTGQNIGNEIRKDCFKHIMSFSFPQVDKFTTGSLVTRVTNDVTQVQNFISQFVRGMIRTSLLMFGSIFFMFRLNTQFGIIVLCAFPLIVGTMSICLWKAYPLFPKLQNELDFINSIMQEDISGIRVIKACVREIYEKVRFGKANDELIKTQLKTLVIFAFMNPVMNALMYGVVALILVMGLHGTRVGTTTPGQIMAAISYTATLLNGILMLVMVFQTITKGIASWKRLKEILESKPEITDGNSDGVSEKYGEIEFRDVSFSYPGTDRVVLKHVNLKINPGETVAIMGATGCGKTTLVNLITRFYDVDEGQVLLDGIDVKEYPQVLLRDKVAVVLQKAELFTQSISENILWGNPQADEADVINAAKIAQADSFITSQPDGYDTHVAERGMSLSGGQKQRISIARAVIKDAEALIFDDSTSALDLKTEADLYAALNEAKPGLTKIIVAQRIASIRRADKIVVIENGTIGAVGNHDELLKTSKTYQDIYYSQMGKEE